jgi:zinc transporter ZupT
MILLVVSSIIAILMVLLGLLLMHGMAGNHLNLDRLKVFIALAAGFILSALFFDLLPETLSSYQAGPRAFFMWSFVGVLSVAMFERYLLPQLDFVNRFFHAEPESLHAIDTHDENVHGEHDAHDHHEHLDEAEHCSHSHDHAHLHAHTHPEVLGVGQVCSAIGCFMICSFFDGITLSSVQAVDHQLGVVLVLGVVLHLLPEGVLSGVMALSGGASFKAARKVLIFIGGAFVLGSMIPLIFSGIEPVFIAMSSGILMFVALVQLLPTALRLKFAPLWIALGSVMFFGSHYLLKLIGANL